MLLSTHPTLASARTILRPPTNNDAAAIKRMFAPDANPALQEWWDDMNPSHLAELLAPPAGFYPFVIAINGQTAGLVQFDICEDPKSRHASLDIGLADEWHGKGFGTEVLQTIIEHLTARGIHRIMIDPNARNERAISLYRRLGFRNVGIIPAADYTFGQQRWEDQLLMVRIESTILTESHSEEPHRL